MEVSKCKKLKWGFLMDTDVKGLYSFREIDDSKLREWILGWREKNLLSTVESKFGEQNDRAKSLLTDLVKGIKDAAVILPIDSHEPNFYYDTIYGLFSELIFKTYFKCNSNSLKVANYYEVLLEAANSKTKKLMINDDTIIKKSGITLKFSGKEKGYIGTVSDLYFAVFRDEYMREDDISEFSFITKSVRNNAEDFTLKIWELPCDDNIDEINEFVDKVLYECSIKLGLDFRVGKFDAMQKELAFPIKKFELEISEEKYNKEPLMYFNFANESSISRHIFLAYYQVIEFYYKKALEIKRPSNPKEKDIITEIIKKAINSDEVLKWLERSDYYLKEQRDFPQLNMLKVDDGEEILNKIANRIYSVRCSIVHSKETNQRNGNFVPNLNDDIIENEISLIKYVASYVLEYWSSSDLS